MSVEIRLRRRHFPITSGELGMVFLGKKQKGGHNNQGTRGAARKARPPAPKGALEAAQEQTRANVRYKVLLPSMKIRMMSQAEYDAFMAARSD